MEPQKRKYQKHKTEGQITVKHFLNKRLKGKKQDNEQTAYPLYVRIMVKGQQSDIKSRFGVVITTDNFEWFKQEHSILLNQEITAIIDIIKSLNPFDRQEFNLQQAVSIYGQSIKPLITAIDELLKEEIRYCIVRNSTDRLSNVDMNDKGQLQLLIQDNDLIGLINWQLPARIILDRLKTIVTDSELSTALSELENMYYQVFNFDSKFNTLNAVHRYLAPPALVDWYNGTLQTDLKSYFTDSGPTVESINHLLQNHF